MAWDSYIKQYQSYLRIERGLSANSIENYTFDILRLSMSKDLMDAGILKTILSFAVLIFDFKSILTD